MKSLLQSLQPSAAHNPITDLPDLDWSVYTPQTNLYWLHYLLHILLYKKKELKKPPPSMQLAGSSRTRSRGNAPPTASSSSASQCTWQQEEINAFRELEGWYRLLDCRPKAAKKGVGVRKGEGQDVGWVGPERGVAGFVDWVLTQGLVLEEAL